MMATISQLEADNQTETPKASTTAKMTATTESTIETPDSVLFFITPPKNY